MGGNAEGALGSPGGDSSVPRPVPGLAGVTRISAGQAHTCVVRTGRVLCWGLNNFGQLGDGTVEDRATPQEVAMAGEATDVALGAFHSCALLRSGAVHCWGRSTDGQMGDGTSWHRATPARVVFR
jgi:alpha-tubulin suppressor-like RCC1 family protein